MLHKYIYILLLLLLKFQDSLSSVMLLIILACINVIKEITNRFTFCYISSLLVNFFQSFIIFQEASPICLSKTKLMIPFIERYANSLKAAIGFYPRLRLLYNTFTAAFIQRTKGQIKYFQTI